ncbi:MAG: L-histidine N(alpha)-methyltransferase [Mangrovicoccus sp.]|nr:L-histidine N(alpha)-methyltransferase [Mangrovicoccus sp.]
MDIQTVKNQDLLRAALAGLSQPQKQLESKWFYDQAGSELFEEITRLPEYYPTRTELGILSQRAGDLAQWVPDGAALLELGAGAGRKTRILLDALPNLGAYLPVDISQEFLALTATRLRSDYPNLPVHPIAGDFHDPIDLAGQNGRPITGFFPGSTIGNLTGDEAQALLARMRALPGMRHFILGCDLVKDPARLIAAYDDAAGVTAKFNLNLLKRLNYEAGADFDLDAFSHEALWNAKEARIEMHLRAGLAQSVRLGGQVFEFAPGESIHTENSHKYTQESITALALRSGWDLAEWYTDAEALFAIAVLRSI